MPVLDPTAGGPDMSRLQFYFLNFNKECQANFFGAAFLFATNLIK